MGTPEFAVPSLTTLSRSHHEVAGVVTVPDKPRGRGQKRRPSAVKQAARQLDLPLWQPEDLSDPAFLTDLRELHLDLMVVVAFRILPEACYSIPTHGAINLHASLLPRYRGAAPIQRALMDGESTTGVSTFFLEPTVDTGAVLLQESLEIGSNENAGSVHDRLAELGAGVVLRTVNGIAEGTLRPVPQDDTEASPAPKITKQDRLIRWEEPAETVHNRIRALSPYPGAYTYWDEKQLIIYGGEISADAQNGGEQAPGRVVGVDEHRIQVACGAGAYHIRELQLQGKRRMEVHDFLNGYPLRIGERFSDSPAER